MSEPRGDRPYMPGYGIVGADEGRGLLPWSWAEERLTAAHDYWVATVRPDGRPHVMPVWGVYLDRALWWSTSRSSRKFRNLERDPRCTVTSDDAYRPVVVDGVAEVRRDDASIHRFVDALNELQLRLPGSRRQRDDPGRHRDRVRARRGRLHRHADALALQLAGVTRSSATFAVAARTSSAGAIEKS